MAGINAVGFAVIILLIISPIGIWNRLIKIHQTERQMLDALNAIKKELQKQTAILKNMTVAEE